MPEYGLDDIRPLLPDESTIVGLSEGVRFDTASTTLAAHDRSIAFVARDRRDKVSLVAQTQARLLLCDLEVELPDAALATRCFIRVRDPKFVFAKIVNALFLPQRPPGVHPTAFVAAGAKLDASAHVGAFAYIGQAEIGANSIIEPHAYVGDGTRIGCRVRVGAGTILGADGFGYLVSDTGETINFPHLGGIEVHDDVEIGANACVDRGSLGNTIIERGAKIDNLVHVAHNVVVGEGAFVIAHAMIGGSTALGARSWISPSAVLRDGIRIGAGSVVGLGAVVTKDVPANETWTGVPARPLEQFLELQQKLKNL